MKKAKYRIAYRRERWTTHHYFVVERWVWYWPFWSELSPLKGFVNTFFLTWEGRLTNTEFNNEDDARKFAYYYAEVGRNAYLDESLISKDHIVVKDLGMLP